MMNYSKRRPSMNINKFMQDGFKPNSAYFVSHNGLGDLLISTSAVRFLLKFYQTVYFICKSWHYNQLSMILSDEPRIKIISLEMNTHKEESNNIWDTLTNAYLNNDIFTCGHYNKIMHSKITNDVLRIYVYETHISYRKNLTTIVETIEMETIKHYATLVLAFNYLHSDIRRKYNTPEKTDQLLDECLQILQFISRATL